jgi:hypothetical protein
MRHIVTAVVVCASLLLGGCWSKQPLNPPRLVTANETDMSIQLFMQATLLLAHYYRFQTIQYSDFESRASRAGLVTLPFMPPETIRATPALVGLIENPKNTPEYLDELANYIVKTYGYKTLVNYYIRTGLRASQLICRNYLLRLEENNRYLEFLRSELGVAYSLATSVLLATHANNTLTNAFAISHNFADNALTAYEEYRFLTIDREAARVLVETVQAKYAEYFMKHVQLATADSTDTAGGFTFSDAIHAVGIIEYQCTREGINALLTRSVNNTPTNVNIDMDTGTIMFDSAKNVTSASDKTVKTTGAGDVPPTTEKPQQPSSPKGTKSGGSSKAEETDEQVKAILKKYIATGDAQQQAKEKQNLVSMLTQTPFSDNPDVKSLGNPPNLDTVLDQAQFAPVRKQMLAQARLTKWITP